METVEQSRRSSTVCTESSGGGEMFSQIEIKKSLISLLNIISRGRPDVTASKNTVIQCFSTSWQSLLQCFIQQNSKTCFFFLFFIIPTSCYNVFSPLGSSEGAVLHFQSTNNSRPEHLKAIWHSDPGVSGRFCHRLGLYAGSLEQCKVMLLWGECLPKLLGAL